MQVQFCMVFPRVVKISGSLLQVANAELSLGGIGESYTPFIMSNFDSYQLMTKDKHFLISPKITKFSLAVSRDNFRELFLCLAFKALFLLKR